MTVTAFTKSSGLGPLPKLLEAAGGPRMLTRVFQAEHLPISLASGEATWLPLHSLLGLFERSAAAAGDDLFGLRVGRAMQPEDFGLWVRYAMSAPSLGGMISRLRRALDHHQSGSEFDFQVSGRRASWSYRVTESVASGHRHHTDHALWPMLVALRRYAGTKWMPLRIECTYDRPQCWRRLEEEFGSPVSFGQPANAIVFDRALLDMPLRHPMPSEAHVTWSDIRRIVAERPPATILDAVRAVVRARMTEPLTDMEGTALVLAMSPRTLQRHLSEENRTFRDVLDEVRMERACELLQESSASVTEIAFSLGYDDATSFSRAFRRWAGHPPNTLRQARRRQRDISRIGAL